MRPNFCTLSPDTLHRFDWSNACKEHDDIYRKEESMITRSKADRWLRKRMLEEVRRRNRLSTLDRIVGYGTAWIYWLAVRIFGWMWWGI